MSKRRTHRPEFKARVAMEAISGRKTIQEIAADHAIHPIQVSQWKRQLLDGASELFTRGKKTKDKVEGQVKEAELFLLGLPRSTLYYRPTPVRESTLRMMARIDALYLGPPEKVTHRLTPQGESSRNGFMANPQLAAD